MTVYAASLVFLGIILNIYRAVPKSKTYDSTPPGPSLSPNPVANRIAALWRTGSALSAVTIAKAAMID